MQQKKKYKILRNFFLLLIFCTYLSATMASLLAARVTLITPTSEVREGLEFVSSIIPQSALILENQIFIAIEQKDVWGDILVAKPVFVKARDLQDGRIAIIDGLVGNEKVIIAWDRPLDSGMRLIED